METYFIDVLYCFALKRKDCVAKELQTAAHTRENSGLLYRFSLLSSDFSSELAAPNE